MVLLTPCSFPDLTWHEFSIKTVELLRCVQDLGLKQSRFGNEYLFEFSLLFRSPLYLAKNDLWTLNPPKRDYRQTKQHRRWLYVFCTSLINIRKADYLLQPQVNYSEAACGYFPILYVTEKEHSHGHKNCFRRQWSRCTLDSTTVLNKLTK